MHVFNNTDKDLFAFGWGYDPLRSGEEVRIPPGGNARVSCPPPIDPRLNRKIVCQTTLTDEIGIQVLPGLPFVFGSDRCGIAIYCDVKDLMISTEDPANDPQA